MTIPATGDTGTYDVSMPTASDTPARNAGGAAVLPARRVAAQAHALRVAAALVERAGVAGLSVVVNEDRITIQVPAHLAGPAARAGAVAVLATALGARPSCDTNTGGTRGWVIADADLAGHDVHVFTLMQERP